MLAGCAPALGDSCGNSADCSVSGDRICDLAQPGGYCTIDGCAADACPDEGVCVEWRFAPDRTARRFCMQTCESNSDCREEYSCLGTADPALAETEGAEDGMPLARVVDDNSARRFCVAIPQ